MGDFVYIFGLAIAIGAILIIRLLGAWMLRINDVIDELKGLRSDLKHLEQDYLIKHKDQPEPEIKETPSNSLLEDLKSLLKKDEMIVEMKDIKELKIIKKFVYKIF